MRTKSLWIVCLLVAAVAAAFAVYAAAPKADGELAFTDAAAQSTQFMEWEKSIELTPEQEAVKKEALTALPAPCCSDNTAYTCCCPCNMSRTIWGLSNHLIAERGANAEQVKNKVQEWIAFINPDGFSGDVCYTGGCGRPMSENGCGGMGGPAKT